MNSEIKNDLHIFTELLGNSSPQEWDHIPDIELYMDQVVAFMGRQHIGLDETGDETLTPAMVNNYIKKGLMSRANGKKYSREHIAYLTAICLMKQVLSVDETGELIKWQTEDRDIQEFYKNYCDTLKTEFRNTAEMLESLSSEEEMRQMALNLAVSGYSQILACKKILQLMRKE